LEYLTPGEITLPLSSHGAEVLDLVLTRLRELAREVKEDEDAIDEYHSLELSLRQQLGARVEAMDGVSRELKRSTSRLKESDERVSELEVGIDRLKGAVEGYRRDISELEDLVQRVEEDGKLAEARLRSEVDAGQQEAARKDDSIAALEAKVASVLSQTGELRIQLVDLQAKKAVEIATLNKSHGGALALRDARVTELRGEIDNINASLRNAHETIRQLRVENSSLRGDVDSERKKAKDAVDSMKAELERVLKMSEGILATPEKGRTSRRRSSACQETADPDLRAGTYLSGELAMTSKGKKRRRYDSGLGFLDEEEYDV
jgi:chromosome segregation ATPase